MKFKLLSLTVLLPHFITYLHIMFSIEPRYISSLHRDWTLSLCFLALLLVYYVSDYLYKIDFFQEEFDYKFCKYSSLLFILITVKYPLFTLSGIIKQPATLFLFHVVDELIIGIALILMFTGFILCSFLLNKSVSWRYESSEERGLSIVVLTIAFFALGVRDVFIAIDALDTYLKFIKGT